MPRITYLNFLPSDDAIRAVNELRTKAPRVHVVPWDAYTYVSIVWEPRDPNCPSCKARGWYRRVNHEGLCGGA